MLMLRLPSACALALLAAATALPAARAVGPCLDNETFSHPSVTHLNFTNVSLVNNTLYEAGGEMRLDGVGIIRDTPVSLVVTDASTDGSYPDITDAWDAKGKNYETMNGLHGTLGTINLQFVQGKANSGKGLFKFCLVDTATGAPMKAEWFVFTLYDIDERALGLDDVKKERALFQTQSATAFQLWRNTTESEVEVDCEDGSAEPCGDVRTRFRSTVEGFLSDNPSQPDNLTDEQKRRAVAVTFNDTDCFEFEYDLYCGSSVTSCRSGGGNFLWGGVSPRLVIESKCVPIPRSSTPRPTDFPSMHPSVVPSAHPSYLPSDAPSDLTSCATVTCCFDCFCCGPGTSWSPAAGCEPDPFSTGCDEEADEEVCYPGFKCLAEDCCPEGTELVQNPNYPLKDRCYCSPVAP